MPPTNQAQTDSVFANWLINKGIAKSESGANIIMIVFVILSFIFCYKMLF
jgi:hypothetical protein